MEQPKIDLERLRGIAAKEENRRKKLEALRESEIERQAEKDAKPIADKVIQDIPRILEERAKQQGWTSAYVMSNIRTLAEKKAAEIVVDYCQKQGMKTEIRHDSSEFEGHYDCIFVTY